jgi:hypothetical protein
VQNHPAAQNYDNPLEGAIAMLNKEAVCDNFRTAGKGQQNPVKEKMSEQTD